jgi:hypothetical protein
MKYLCLVYVEETVLNAMPKDQRQVLSDESMAYCDRLQKAGQLLAASPLHPVETATTVRVCDGHVSMTDGPFAGTKEQLGGFFLIEAKNLDEALAVASPIPGARIGTVEIRPVRSVSGLPNE